MPKFDRQITISTASKHDSLYWPPQTLLWSEFAERVRVPVRGAETLAQYLALPKTQQDELKDVGGFVGGTFRDNRRKANLCTGRAIITLDMDNIKSGETENIIQRLNAMQCSYVIYSTRKHCEAKPRLRVIIPLDRAVSGEEYIPIALKFASYIGMDLCDPTTFRVHQLMYWPSVCSDSQYVYVYEDKPFLNADNVLAAYTDWHDAAQWPVAAVLQQAYSPRAVKQEDPTTKTGIIGAFCKIYNIYQAIDQFLPGEYTQLSNDSQRYTFVNGSTVGGAIIYDNGTFLYSHHATDPAGGKLVNAFDLVRLHLYGDTDYESPTDTPVSKLPSFAAMRQLAITDTEVAKLLNQERYERAVTEFSSAVTTVTPAVTEWLSMLQLNPNTGLPVKTLANVRILLEFDPNLSNRIFMDTFADRIMGIAPFPWRRNEEGPFVWADKDDRNLREYVERILKFRSKDLIEDALYNHANTHGINPIKEYLESVKWDGIPRADTLYVDYLGAEDSDYVRAVTRKGLVAAVSRITTPGIKFDTMTVINGPQGIGKSTLLAKLGGPWFSDSLQTFEGKDAAEMLQGFWILEISELAAYGKSDIRTIKQFLSKQGDNYRGAYLRRVEEHPRKCIFFGTTNDVEYLNDSTGNRRFWPVEAGINPPTKSIWKDFDGERDQIWAEAYFRWQMDESLILPPTIDLIKAQEKHIDRDPLQGQIEDFLDQPIPEDWRKWAVSKRNAFWGGGLAPGNTVKLIERAYVCVVEIWQECLGMQHRMMSKGDANRINAILRSLSDWEPVSNIRVGAEYGRQRGFKRKVCTRIFTNNVLEFKKEDAVNNVNILK